jgi:hypothetical protein
LFWVSLPEAHPNPGSRAGRVLYFPEVELQYEQFFADFGPVSLGKVARFVRHVAGLLEGRDANGVKPQVYCCTPEHSHRRSNAAFLLGAYLVGTNQWLRAVDIREADRCDVLGQILKCRQTAMEAYRPFIGEPRPQPSSDDQPTRDERSSSHLGVVLQAGFS